MADKQEQEITAYKGFGPDFRCRGFQYAIGQTYTHEGEVELCDSGFHCCPNPLDVLQYYPPISDEGAPNRYAEVRVGGAIVPDPHPQPCPIEGCECGDYDGRMWRLAWMPATGTQREVEDGG